MIRLQVRKVAERYGFNRYIVGRASRVSEQTMEKVWIDENTNIMLPILDKIADGINILLQEKGTQERVTLCDLIEIVNSERHT